ncbi:MAG TPA: hypothetical protein VKE51_30775 [Vicinamibacterales bacterium]|nr:hypothetical protein [Vicinamibacterales bacterium]
MEADPKYPVFGFYFRRYAPWALFGGVNPYTNVFGNFEGDNRKTSTSLKVTARTYGCVMFNRAEIVHWFAGSDFTRFHPTLGAVITGLAKGDHTMVRSRLAGPDIFGFSASTAAHNPLVKPSPDINTFVDVTIDFGTPATLAIRGAVFGDVFPNLEVFLVCYRSARTALLVDGQAPTAMLGGTNVGPVLALPGAGKDQSLGKINAHLMLDERGTLANNSTVRPSHLFPNRTRYWWEE